MKIFRNFYFLVTEVNTEEIDDIEPEPHINNAIGKNFIFL